MEENARPIIIILCHGESRSRFFASICLSICPFLLRSLSFFYPPRPLVSASIEPAVLLFTPTNGGSFCFTFVLISNDGDLELHLRLYCADVSFSDV